jgi:hypothetical protein
MEALMIRLALTSSLLVSASLLGCGSVEDPDPKDMGDTTAPTIVSVTPSAGQAGVPASATIVITFSEPMDRVATEAAYSSQHLPAGSVTMSWNETSDTLTITPNQPLALAEGIGNDPSVTEAKLYALWITTAALDSAGNPLAEQLQLEFTTQKHMATTAPFNRELTRYRVSNGGVSAIGADLRIGDNAMLTYRGFVTFDLSALPEGIEIATAELGVSQTAIVGTPFDLGALSTVHVTYALVNGVAWSAPALSTMDPLTTTAALGPRTVDISAAVAEDYADRIARGNYAQFRLEFPKPNNNDVDSDMVELGTASFKMSLEYLAD